MHFIDSALEIHRFNCSRLSFIKKNNNSLRTTFVSHFIYIAVVKFGSKALFRDIPALPRASTESFLAKRDHLPVLPCPDICARVRAQTLDPVQNRAGISDNRNDIDILF